MNYSVSSTIGGGNLFLDVNENVSKSTERSPKLFVPPIGQFDNFWTRHVLTILIAGHQRGFALIIFFSVEEAQTAFTAMPDVLISGRQISLEYAFCCG